MKDFIKYFTGLTRNYGVCKINEGYVDPETGKKKFSCLQHRSQNVHVSKASESISAMLEIIAPGDAGALWTAIKKSKLVERKLDS